MKDSTKILLLLLLLGGIIFFTIKINNSDIKPIITLNKSEKKDDSSKKEEKKEESKKEEEKKEEEKKEETPEEPEPTPAPEPTTAQATILPNAESKTILCSQSKQMGDGTAYTLQLLGYYDRVGGTMTQMLIYSGIEASNITIEQRQQLASALEQELKNKFPSFTSKSSATDIQAEALLTGTPQDLIKDYSILDEQSLEYYNFAPTLRYEGYTCTIN